MFKIGNSPLPGHDEFGLIRDCRDLGAMLEWTLKFFLEQPASSTSLREDAIIFLAFLPIM